MPRRAADLADVLEAAVVELEIPGVAIGLLDGGEVSTWTSGVTHLRRPSPVSPETLFQVGSISKTFVATCAAVLMQRGHLDIDAPVQRYLPDLSLSTPELTGTVTLRHLLTHTGGWVGDYFADTGEGEDALAVFVGKLAKAPQLTPPGTTYSYSNSAFNLASHVVATVYQTTYERAVRDLILRPLELRDTVYSAQDAITRPVAIGHRAGQPQPWRRPRAHHGAGGVVSSASDMIHYAALHLGARPDVLGPDTVALMQSTAHTAGSLCDEVGLGWMIDQIAGYRVVHHGGTTNGYQADLRLVPELDLAWVVLTNGAHEHQLDRVLIETLLGPHRYETGYVPGDLTAYAGRYEAVLNDLEVTVFPDGLRLDVTVPARALWNPGDAVAPGRPTRLAFRDADRVVALDMPFTGHRGEFLRDPDGGVAWMRWDGRIARRVS